MKSYNKANIPLAKALRKNMTPWERKLWYDFLRSYPVRFQRQKAIGNYIADFYCAKAKLVIELDGSQHFSEMGIARDGERTAFLEQYDLHVIRIPNQMIWQDFDRVCEYIDDVVRQSLSRLRDSSLCTREPM